MGRFRFSDMIGNVYTKEVIKHSLSSLHFPQLAIYEGTLGTGKSTMAQITAMAITCENPVVGNPCCKCCSCQQAIRALGQTGETSNIKIINLGAFDGKADVQKLIQDIFVLRSGSGKRVYVLEEAHALRYLPGAQTALLNEFDRMPADTYVIMCTTKVQDLIPEIQSRGILFKFKKLKTSESIELAKEESMGKVPANILDIVVKQSKGIPRNIIKSVQFIRENDIDYDTYVEFISDVSDSVLTELFTAMSENDILPFVMMLDNLLETRDVGVLVQAVKDYLARVLFQFYGAKTDMAGADRTTVEKMFDDSILSRMLVIVDSMAPSMTDAEFKLSMFKLRLAMQSRSIKSVYADSQRSASVAKERAKEIRAAKVETVESVLKPLDLSKLQAF